MRMSSRWLIFTRENEWDVKGKSLGGFTNSKKCIWMIQNGKRKSFEIIFRTMQKKSSWKLQEMITYHLLVFFFKRFYNHWFAENQVNIKVVKWARSQIKFMTHNLWDWNWKIQNPVSIGQFFDHSFFNITIFATSIWE